MPDLTTPIGNLYTDDVDRATAPGFTEAVAKNRDAIDQAVRQTATAAQTTAAEAKATATAAAQTAAQTAAAIKGIKQGESAYQIAVRNGFVGTELEWLASLPGATGAQFVDNGTTVTLG